MKELLEHRKRVKAKKPDFLRQDAHKLSKLGTGWKKPKGIDSKMRLKLKGYRRSVTKGWKSPSKIRGMTSEGLLPVRISNLDDLKPLDAKKHIIIISSKVGHKKKIDIVKKAKALSFKFHNLADPDGFLKKVEEKIAAKKKEKEAALKEKEKKDLEKKKAAEKKEQEEKKKQEEKKVQEKAAPVESAEKKVEEDKEKKKEQDKILISKQQ